ncbi:hypothetical protein [Corynebacterium testudinoris]|uniref:Uncharacterized protein n=1 Tax=Corynebacterium testudinoris TaxID=136857 RepID=A0A0G3H2M2_9CORY|nr:hypothetical protein [Corynebacterium testudinoris]AKK07619.1 hypothetical protein CTEST_00745 [Corynebacterium testudinoris]
MTDYYSLDDTLAGRVAQASVAGTIMSLPDYIESKFLRFLVGTGIFTVGMASVAVLNALDDDPDNDLSVVADNLRRSIGDIGKTAGPEWELKAGDISVDSPARTWLIIGGVGVVSAGLLKLDGMMRRSMVKSLRKRGVKRPNTVLGVIAGVSVFALSELSHRQRVELAE